MLFLSSLLTSLSKKKNKRVASRARLNYSRLNKLFKKKSPMMKYLSRAIQCGNCHHENTTFHVYCPYCIGKAETKEDMEACKLISCPSKTCEANIEYSLEEIDKASKAQCRHLSRKCNEQSYTPILHPEFALASLVTSGLIEDCALLSEDELLESIDLAVFWKYYCTFFSLNAATCYRNLGYTRMAEAIMDYNVEDTTSSIEIIRSVICRIQDDQVYFNNGIQSKDW